MPPCTAYRPEKKKYNPLPNAVRLFRCDLCAKDYSRQPDYEAHLRSYDHTHRTRMADMKKLTAANEEKAKESSRNKGDLRTVDTGRPGPKFTKIGGGEAPSRFKKVGTAVGDAKPGFTKIGSTPVEEAKATPDKEAVVERRESEDVVMTDAQADGLDPDEEYDFTKPTGCDWANCRGCQLAAAAASSKA